MIDGKGHTPVLGQITTRLGSEKLARLGGAEEVEWDCGGRADQGTLAAWDGNACVYGAARSRGGRGYMDPKQVLFIS